MKFSMTPENKEAAMYHMQLEIMANLFAIKGIVIGQASEDAEHEKELLALYDKRLDKIRDEIHETIFANFGSVDIKDIENP